MRGLKYVTCCYNNPTAERLTSCLWSWKQLSIKFQLIVHLKTFNGSSFTDMEAAGPQHVSFLSFLSSFPLRWTLTWFLRHLNLDSYLVSTAASDGLIWVSEPQFSGRNKMAAVSLALVTVSGGGRTKMQKLEQQRYRRVVCGNPENKH